MKTKLFSLILTLWVSTSLLFAQSGTCGAEGDGSNLTWVLTEDGTLTISGTGRMKDYGLGADIRMPWYGKWSSIIKIVINSGVTSIGNEAFLYCSSLISVTIPNSVTSIEGSAFKDCKSLTSLTIPNSVTSIGGDAFSGCTGLTSITIPNSVTSIGNDAAFSDVLNIVYSGTATGAPWGARSMNGYVEGNLVYRDATKTELLACSAIATGEITIPNSVMSIGEYAFSGCTGLTSITISNSVTSIGRYAFSYCSSLTSITIPNSVTSIGDMAFYYCKGLTSITIPNSVTSIGWSVFPECSRLTSVVWNAKNCNASRFGSQVESFVFGDEVEVIPNRLCSGMNKLTSITIPKSVTSIGDRAFQSCSKLTSVTIPNSVTSIGSQAFYDCSNLTSVTIGNSVTSIGDYAFRGCSSLTSVTIPNSVTSIGDNAFYGCNSLPVIDKIRYADTYVVEAVDKTLNSYEIKEGTRFIGNSAFSGCDSLTSITLSNSLTSIGEYAFKNCSSLPSITLPNSVQSIGQNAFYNCSNLKAIFVPCGELDRFKKMDGADYRMKYVPSSYTLAGKSATNGYVSIPSYSSCDESITITARPNRGFRFVKWSDGNTDNPRTVYLTEDQTFEANFDYALMGKCGKDSLLIWTLDTATMSLTISGNGALSENYTYGSFIESITIGDDVTTIGDYAFSNCAALTSITIGSDVTSIGDRAFSGCSSLTSVTIPNSVTSIGNEAFRGCGSLTSITIPNGVTSIGDYAFYYCQGLTSITIPNSVTSIGNYAFYNCQGLTSITIPNSVTSIGNYAFNNVPNIVYSGTATGAPWGARSLNGYVEGNLVYRDATKTELLACFAAATGEITIPNSVTSIGRYAFRGCTGLTSVTIPNSVTSIGIWAFENCSSLTSITIPNSVTSIGEYAFYNVPNIVYSGTATGAPWGARSLNGYVEGNLVYRDATKTELLACSAAATGEITIPNSVTSIGNEAFRGCGSLTSITIPNSVTSIGNEAFRGCGSLEDIFVPCGELERFTQMFNDSYNTDYSDKLKIASSPHTLTIKDTKYGTVSVPDYNGCDESVMITAIPDPHCRFVKWSDGNTDNPRPVYLTEDITLEALFVYTLTDKCGKDYLLTWTLDTIKMAMDITGKGSLSDNYTYHTTFATLTIGNEVTTIGADAFSDCDNLQYLTLGSSVRVIESGAFACSDIKTITCYNKRPPTVNNDAFCNLDYETIIYVPKDYLENYQMHAFWGMFDVRPIGASGTETDKVKVEPAETTATVAWPTINGAGSYELVIRDKDGNALCTLVFNAQGQLTSIDFAAAPARDRSNVAAMAQGAGFAFTVTGLESGTMYKYSFITKNASGTVIDTKTGAFTTQSPTALEDIMDNASSSSSVRKVLQNGRLYILRDGKVYNATGAEVK